MLLDTTARLQWEPFLPNDYVFKIAETSRELAGFWELRREVFCHEQGIFEESDRDDIDEVMLPIIATSLLMGMEDQVIGAVRIDERTPGLWWGSRLCVEHAYRNIPYVSRSVCLRNQLPLEWASIGAGLTYTAVTTALARGCHTFLAFVQAHNAGFFERLHWMPLEDIAYHGLPHIKMQADLGFYADVHARLEA